VGRQCADAVEIHPGAEMREHWGGPGILDGRVRRIEDQRVIVLIDVTSPQQAWAGLGDTYQVDARITAFTQDDAMP